MKGRVRAPLMMRGAALLFFVACGCCRGFPITSSFTTVCGRSAYAQGRGIVRQSHSDMSDCGDVESNFPGLGDYARLNRRTALGSLLAASSALLVSPAPSVSQPDIGDAVINALAIDCLRDLPPFDPETTVRLYLCRHGQTENNRLNLMQGARVDTSLNDTGEKQAQLLGKALSRAKVPPTQILYSPLQRAKQTAKNAANQFTTPPPGHSLASLAELDFGETAESEPVETVRAAMVATYTAWAAGNLDARMAGGGETGREMLARIDTALLDLLETASQTKSGCIAAVSHSAYLRMMLATVDGNSLLTASKIKLENCCVNVLDIRKPLPVGESSKSASSVAAKDSFSAVSMATVIRMNEKRHLISLSSP